jgi:hypothetical protein
LLQAGRTDEAIAALERGERCSVLDRNPKRLVLGYPSEDSQAKRRSSYVTDFPEDDFMRGLLKQVPR